MICSNFRSVSFPRMRKCTQVFFILAGLSFGCILFIFQNHRFQGYVRTSITSSLEADTIAEHILEARKTKESVLEVNTLKDTRTIQLTERIYKERVNYAMSQCYSQKKHKVANVIKHDGHKLAYCKVPKVGCTFWMRMLLYLYNDTGGTAVKSPFEIPRMFVHSPRKQRLRTYRNFSSIQGQITDYTRFMFARDPFSRLWSAYLDKFRLPDFWRSFASQVVNRRKVISDIAKRCRHDVTFEEFLQYVVSLVPEKMNEHWIPVSYHCDPCLFKPTVIGKVETFNDDAKYILSNIGYEEILSSFSSETYVEEELTMLTDYNFDLLKGSFYRGCLDQESLGLLLWEVFQLNGYLPKEVNGADALRNLTNMDKASFKNFVINFYRSASKEDKHLWKLQKAAALKDAFKSIPKSLTDKLLLIYKEDFSMFGYDSMPPGYETQ